MGEVRREPNEHNHEKINGDSGGNAACWPRWLPARGQKREPGATDSTLQNTAGQSWESQAISESRQSEEEGLESSRVSVSNSTATEASDRPKETAKQIDTTKIAGPKQNRQRKRRSSPISM